MSIDPVVRLRLLPVIRLSVNTDETTSPERQMENIERFAVYKQHDLVPITEADYDLDVSGSVSPFDRPGLGRWLKPDRLDQWDALVVAKLDRISRSLFDFTTLIHFLEAHGKSLIILDPALDLTTKEGRTMGNILMTFAEYEREIIGARVKEAINKLMRDGKWKGGVAPFGYRQVKLDKNWGLEVDPVLGPVVREMAERYLRYETLGSIVKWLRESGVPSPMDSKRARSLNPKTQARVKSAPWNVTAVRLILRSMSVLGAVTDTKGNPVRDDQGMVIYRAAPLLADDPREARDMWERIKARLDANKRTIPLNASPLLQVAFCGACGGPMHRTVQRPVYNGKVYEYAYYRCWNTVMATGKCNTRRVKANPLEDAVYGAMLEVAGHRELTEERIEAGRDYSEEAARLIEQTSHLMSEIGRARLQRRDFSDLQATLERANAELDQLATLEPEPAKLIRTPTGKKFRDWWNENDQAARNAFLRENGVRAVAHPETLPKVDYDSRPVGQRSMVVIDQPDLHAVIYLGNLGDILRNASDLSITVQV